MNRSQPHARWSVGFGLAALVVSSSARAEHAEARLVYERLAGAERCGDETELRAAIAERLGYDPFVDREDVSVVVVRVRASGSGLGATIERQEPSGKRLGNPSTLTSKSALCTDLLATIATAAAIAVDPLSLAGPEATTTPLPSLPSPEPNAKSAPEPEPRAPATPAALPPAAPGRKPTWLVGAGPHVAFGALPAVSFGTRVFAGFALGRFEFDAEGRFDAPVRYYAGRQHIDASLAQATLSPCLRYGLFLSCAQVSMGALRGTGFGYDSSREDTSFYMTAGARQAIVWELGRHVSVRLNVDGAVVLRPIRLEADGQALWSTPSFALSVSPMLVGRFP